MNMKDKCIFGLMVISSIIIVFLLFFNLIANTISNIIPRLSILQGYFIGMVLPDMIYIKLFWNEKLNRGVNPLKGRGNITSTGEVFLGAIVISIVGFIINTYYLQTMIENFNRDLFQRTYEGVILYLLYIFIFTPLIIIICAALVFPAGFKNTIASLIR